MSDRTKISFRLSPALQAALATRVRQRGGLVSDVIREALEAYLGIRPTARPTEKEDLSDELSDRIQMSDTMSDVSAQISGLVSDIAGLQERLEELEAFLETRPPRVRQRPTERPTEGRTPATTADTPQARTPTGQRKLTPRQVRALRDKHLRGVPIAALMEEYGISRASVFRYLQSDKR